MKKVLKVRLVDNSVIIPPITKKIEYAQLKMPFP